MHALVIGTSYYTYLPQNPGDPPPDGVRETLGLGQATTPASSALAFARWLETEYHNPAAPMGSIRLLVSPSQEEKGRQDALANPEDTVLSSNTTNVKAALRVCKLDCEKNRDNAAVFYVAGHGIMLSKDDSIVLLEDFGDPVENVLGCAMDIGAIWRGMSSQLIAKTQFYFVDACRIKPDVFSDYETNPVGVTLDVTEGGTAAVAPIFFGSAPRSFALGEPGRGTLFCQALLDCFALHGVKGPDNHERWTVTTASLLESLDKRVAELAAAYHEEQKAFPGGTPANEVFHVLPGPPEVPLHISLKPNKAYEFARAKLWDGLTDEVVFNDVEFTPCLDRKVPGGTYVLSVKIQEGAAKYKGKDSVPVAAFPPECRMEIPV
ncbi:hypothetical protein ES703_96392 [subsurface metagenome]